MFANLFGGKKQVGDPVGYGVDPSADGGLGFPMQPQSGGFLNKVGLAGDILTGNPATANRQNQMLEDDFKRQQAMTARYRALHPDPTGTMQNAAAGGLTPGTPAYQKWVLDNGGRPNQYYVLGNPEGGQQIVNPSGMPGGQPPAQPAAPQPGAVQGGYRFLGGDPSLPTSWQQVQ